jgi:hypothetical protein
VDCQADHEIATEFQFGPATEIVLVFALEFQRSVDGWHPPSIFPKRGAKHGTEFAFATDEFLRVLQALVAHDVHDAAISPRVFDETEIFAKANVAV